MGAKLFSGTTQYVKLVLSPKINLFGLHKIASCPWQPIGHCSWVICKQTQYQHLRAAHFFMDFFSLPLIQENQAVSYWRKKWSLNSKENMGQGVVHRTTYPPPHNVKIHNMILKKVCVPITYLRNNSGTKMKAHIKFFLFNVLIFKFSLLYIHEY